jgi:hypothetical protein
MSPLRLVGLAGALVLPVLTVLPAQAQMFHLYLQCQGSVAAGVQMGVQPAQAAPAQAPAPAPSPAPSSRGVDLSNDKDSDKNSADADPNIQARARAVKSAAKRGNAHLELALRDNNMTAFVQRSNVLPTGERMKYTATQTHYSAAYTPAAGSRAYVDWRGSWLFTWYPPFQKMAATRFSIDRQTGALEGEIVGPAGEVLGLMDMQCEPKKEGEGPAPRF